MIPIISISDASVVESINFNPQLTFTVTLDVASTSTVRVSYRTLNGTALGEGTDYFDEESFITFNPGETSKQITIEVQDVDTLDEGDESLFVELFNPSQAGFAGGLNTVRGIGFILDDDGSSTDIGLFVSDAKIIEGDSGTSQAIFEVWLSEPASGQTSFAYTTVNGSAVSGQDFVAKSGTITFSGGQQMVTVAVDVNGDNISELAEMFSLAVTPTSAVVNGAQGAVGEATIFDDDAANGNLPTISISRGEVVESVNFSPEIRFTVSLSQSSTSTVRVSYQTVNGTSLGEGTDFFDETSFITFNPGETSKTITIDVQDVDGIDEFDENFWVELFNPVQATFGGDANTVLAPGFILDDDGSNADLGLFVSNPTIIEGDNGQSQAVFEIYLSSPSNTALSFSYTTADGSAIAGSDYTAKSGTISFAAGQTFAAVHVNVAGDTIAEIAENFSLVLTPTAAIANGVAGAAGEATILDDDASNGNLPTFTISDGEIVESVNFSPEIRFQVTLSQPSSSTVQVSYRTLDGTGNGEGIDYFDESSFLTFSPGQTSKFITIDIQDVDNIDEFDESFIVELFNAVQATFEGDLPTARALGIILDDDGGTNDIGLFVQDTVILEANAGETQQAIFEIRLSEPATSTLTFNFVTADGTAAAGVDYVAKSGTVTFLPGQTYAAVAVDILTDSVAEQTEQFSLVLTPTGAIANGAVGAVGEATLLDNDGGDGNLPVVSIARGQVIESANFSPQIEFVVTLSQQSASFVTVSYATQQGAAQSGSDFFAASSFVQFSPGQTSKSIFISVEDNDNLGTEFDEDFFVMLSNPQNAVLEGGAPTVSERGIILDDDGFESNLALFVDDVVIREDQASDGAFVEAILSRPAPGAITFTYSTQAGTATAGSDFTAVNSGTFTFAPGQQVARIPVNVFDNGLSEGTERFFINIVGNGAVANGAGGFSITVDLTDGDDASTNANDDFIFGGSLISGRANNNGIDIITPFAAPENNLVRGEGGADRFGGGDGDDVIFGGSGNDSLFGEDGNDRLFGDGNNDRIQGGLGDDLLEGGSGADTLRGALGEDTLNGDGGNDKLFGGGGADILSGGGGNDRLRSEAGNDTVSGGANDDRIFGSFGFDSLRGNSGDDLVDGNGGNDTLIGDSGNDTLIGNFGFDSLNGGFDDDRLIGSTGNDRLTGGGGNDTFVFAQGDGNDRISDFVSGAATDDVIELSGFGAAFDTFAEVLAASSQAGASVVIDFGGGDTIRLLNTSLGDLHQDDFLFV